MKKQTPKETRVKPLTLTKDTLRRLDLKKTLGGSANHTRRTSGYICC
jgi:hypothetical protein